MAHQPKQKRSRPVHKCSAQVNDGLNNLVLRPDGLGIGLIRALRHDHVDQFIGQIDIRLLQRAGLNGVNDGAGGRDAETFANAIATAGPAGVDQENLGIEVFDALDQQIGIYTSRAREEGCAEAGGEGGFEGFGGSDLGGTNLRGIAAEEMVAALSKEAAARR